jgi:hypothetical protein
LGTIQQPSVYLHTFSEQYVPRSALWDSNIRGVCLYGFFGPLPLIVRRMFEEYYVRHLLRGRSEFDISWIG